jgi:broad specificity phosphatase PhoE
MSDPKTIYFVRHGESQANLDGVYAGWADSPLTDRGRAQAHAGAKEASRLGIEKIISSDLHRAFETACIIADTIGVERAEIITDGRLREVNVGKLTGTSERGLPGTSGASDLGYAHYSKVTGNPMEVEPIENLHQRLQELALALNEYPEKTLLLVGHDISGLALQQVLEHRHDDIYALQSFPNGKVVEFFRGAIT